MSTKKWERPENYTTDGIATWLRATRAMHPDGVATRMCVFPRGAAVAIQVQFLGPGSGVRLEFSQDTWTTFRDIDQAAAVAAAKCAECHAAKAEFDKRKREILKRVPELKDEKALRAKAHKLGMLPHELKLALCAARGIT